MRERHVHPGNSDGRELAKLIQYLFRVRVASEEPCLGGSDDVNVLKSPAVGCESPLQAELKDRCAVAGAGCEQRLLVHK